MVGADELIVTVIKYIVSRADAEIWKERGEGKRTGEKRKGEGEIVKGGREEKCGGWCWGCWYGWMEEDRARLFVRELILITDGEGVLGNSVSFVV